MQVLALEKIDAGKAVRDISAQIAALPMVRQSTFNGLVGKLTNISGHLASVAEYSATTSHRLAGIAHDKVHEIDDAKPLDQESSEALKGHRSTHADG